MIPDDVYEDVLSAVSNVGADLSHECEEFLAGIRTNFSGDDYQFVDFVRANTANWFRCVSSYPEWIQNAEWQFHNGKPMLFVGQIALPASAGIFHDEAAIFVFLSETGVIKNVIQVA